jgi:hypothetical protein
MKGINEGRQDQENFDILTRDGRSVPVAKIRPEIESTPLCSGGPLLLGEECRTSKEDEYNKSITNAAVKFQSAQNPTPGTLSKRDFHPKSTACVAGVVKVTPNLPEDLRQGVFATEASLDGSGLFKAAIRFSNGSPAFRPDGTIGLPPDAEPDARAMAVKILGVNGFPLLTSASLIPGQQTQDLMMTNHPVFFIRNIDSAIKFFPALLRGQSLDALDAHEKQSLIAGRKKIDDIFNETYWSQSAYRFGPGKAAKFITRPLACSSLPLPPESIDRTNPDFLRSVAQKRLDKGTVCFGVFVQRQTDPIAMPTEDVTITWDETISIPVQVATITIPGGQNVLDHKRHSFCESLSFNPWNGIKEHKPLGAIGRIRQTAYSGVSAKRRIENNVNLEEPLTNDEFFGVLRNL